MKAKTLILFVLFISVNAFAGVDNRSTNPVYPNSINKSVNTVEEVFKGFFLHRQNNSVVLNWAVSSSNISSFVIQRSYDGEYFEDVEASVTTIGRWSRHIDKDVFPGYIHYRVVAVLNDGTCCYSTVQMIRIVARK